MVLHCFSIWLFCLFTEEDNDSLADHFLIHQPPPKNGWFPFTMTVHSSLLPMLSLGPLLLHQTDFYCTIRYKAYITVDVMKRNNSDLFWSVYSSCFYFLVTVFLIIVNVFLSRCHQMMRNQPVLFSPKTRTGAVLCLLSFRLIKRNLCCTFLKILAHL